MTRDISTPSVKTRTVLVAAMTLIVSIVTASSLWIVRRQMRRDIQANIAANLSRSIEAFQNLQADRLVSQQRTGALLADLPTLKALMTTGDSRTIQDGSVEFWRTSDSDLFALASSSGQVVASFTRGAAATSELNASLQQLLLTPDRYDVVEGHRLFAVSVHPLYFGSEKTGTLLGYVFTGFAIDAPFVQQLSHASAVDVTFLSGRTVLASSVPNALSRSLFPALPSGPIASTAERAADASIAMHSVQLEGDRYLTVSQDLSSTANVPLQIVLMQSLSGAEGALRRINALVLLVGVLATLAGAVLMGMLARAVTRPLETLAAEVGAFGHGDAAFESVPEGTTEIRELNQSFRAMCEQIAASHSALLQSERLATIGRMANSVSHDLRHYLAAVYANAEFLAGPGLSDEERKEIFSDIRSAVLGTTEMMDALLLFSRSKQHGGSSPKQLAPLAQVVRGALALAEAHPDAAGVVISQSWTGPKDATCLMHPRQVERALLNLVLNGCQADRAHGVSRQVSLITEVGPEDVSFAVTDNGLGVPEQVRNNLFEAFVSEGKQKGTGLGLTLVQSIAAEHGGTIRLLGGGSGSPTFELRLPRISATPADLPFAATDTIDDKAEAQ